MTEVTTTEQPQHPFEKGLELYEAKADYNEIIPLFEQGVTLSPRDSVGYTCLAWLHLLRRQDGDADKALNYAQQAVRLDGNNFQAHINLVLAMLTTGETGVRQVFQRAMARVQTPDDRQEVLENLNDAMERAPEWDAPGKVLKWMDA